MNLEGVKGIAAFVLFSLTLACCSLPICLFARSRSNGNPPRHRYRRVVSLISCCGGGVFLGTCLLHLFPDVQKQMGKVLQVLQLQTDFPVAEFLMASGFLLILLIEQTVLSLQQHTEALPFLTHNHSHDGVTAQVRPPQNYGATSQNSEVNEIEVSVHEDHSSHSVLRSVVLVLALSLHSIFEGFAIGLQSTSQNVVRILVAVLIHKSIIAFTLGLNLIHSKLNKCSIIQCIMIFSATSPVGVIAGILITDMGNGISMIVASGVLQGIACGTFVYVTFFEVLPHEFNSRMDKMCKVLCLLLGFGAIALLVLFIPA